MKTIILLPFFLILSLGACAQEKTPVQIVDEQLEAYNNRDIDAFLATYHQDIKIYNHPNTLSMDGKEAMRKVYANMFEKIPDLNAKIVNRITIGNKVIDQEQVKGFGEGKDIHAVAIYEVKDGLIYRVDFLR